jgi:hypothetical protein
LTPKPLHLFPIIFWHYKGFILNCFQNKPSLNPIQGLH